MPRTRTLANLRADVRALADIEGQLLRHTDASLSRLINQEIAEYRRRFHDAFAAEVIGVLTPGVALLPLPADHDVLLSLELGDPWYRRLPRYQLAERADWTATYDARGVPESYRLQGANARLLPVPDRAIAYRLLYVPQVTDLSADSDAFDPILAGGEDVIVYGVAVRIAQRDKLPSLGYLTADLEERRGRIAESLRDTGSTHRVDTRGRRLAGTRGMRRGGSPWLP